MQRIGVLWIISRVVTWGAILIILFSGDPNLLGTIIDWIQSHTVVCQE